MKKSYYLVSLLLLSLLVITSCGKSAGKKLKEAKEKVENVSAIAKNATKIEERSEEIQNIAAELQTIDPISKEQFKEWMPEQLSDLKRTSFEFNTTMGSNGTLKYMSSNDDDSEVSENQSFEINIIDGAGEMGSSIFAAQGLFTGLLMDSYDSEDEYKLEQIIERKGVRAWETYYKEDNRTEIKTTIGNRFIINVDAKNMKPEEAWKLIDQLKIDKLK